MEPHQTHQTDDVASLVAGSALISPARCLERRGSVGSKTRVRAGSFRIHRAAVLVGVVVSPLFITDHLQRLAEVHQCGGETGETSHSVKRMGK